MALLILLAVVALTVLAVLKVITYLITLVGILIVLLFAAWRLDRARRPGAVAPYTDANRPDFYGQSSESAWETPTTYIDHPSGAGTPPGIDEDERPDRR